MTGPYRKIVRAIGLVLLLAGFILTARWYIAWLNPYVTWSPLNYYLPRRLAVYLLAVITSPAIPFAVIIHWMWHGWPTEASWGFSSWILGYALLILGRKRETSEDVIVAEHE